MGNWKIAFLPLKEYIYLIFSVQFTVAGYLSTTTVSKTRFSSLILMILCSESLWIVHSKSDRNYKVRASSNSTGDR